MKRLLLTAFEPFGGESLNSSFQAARRISDMSFRDALVQVIELPVDRHLAVERALEALRKDSPDVVVMLGEAGGRYRVNPERVAVNIDDFRIPDNAGNKPSDEPIVQGGPVAYFSTLPIRAITERLVEARIPAAISNSAGTFLCNRLFYSVMHAIASEGRATKAGFIHLPFLHEQTIPKQVDQPGLSLESLVEGVRLAIEASLEGRS